MKVDILDGTSNRKNVTNGDIKAAARSRYQCYRVLAKKYHVLNDLRYEQVLWLLSSAKICCYCGITLCGKNVSLDHIVPLARGGANSIGNLVVCCLYCNSSKMVKDAEEFIATRRDVLIPITESERVALQQAAESANLTMSEYARHKIFSV